jgi:hypothetical protein
MRTTLLAAAAALSMVPLGACSTYGYNDWGTRYRDGAYDPYPLGYNDTVYRGADGRYYCRRRDGTVGLVVGAGVGALLGDRIAPRGSRTIGAIIGGAAGAAAGYSIGQEISCR